MNVPLVVIVALVAYIIVVCVSLAQNKHLLKSADHRLDKANEMVLTLAHSADKLASSVSELKDMMVHLESVYTSRNDMLVKNRDEFSHAYKSLLKKYEEQQDEIKDMQKIIRDQHTRFTEEMLHTLQEIARKPTISNNMPNTTKS